MLLTKATEKYFTDRCKDMHGLSGVTDRKCMYLSDIIVLRAFSLMDLIRCRAVDVCILICSEVSRYGVVGLERYSVIENTMLPGMEFSKIL